jgi:sugar lactone lactonase YvrE
MPSLKDAACEMDSRVVAIDVRSRAVTPLATEFEGKSFQMPNDLVLDRGGGIYFADAGRRPPTPGCAPEAFYYLSTRGELTRLATNLKRPNGIIRV